MKPETVHPVSDGRWVALDQWPSDDVEMKTLSMTYGHLQEEENKKAEMVDLCTLPNHAFWPTSGWGWRPGREPGGYAGRRWHGYGV